MGEPEGVRRGPPEEQSFGFESGHPLVCQKKWTGVKISIDPWTVANGLCSRSKVWRGTGRSETKKSGVERCGWTCGNELAVWRS